jgi:NAD(P)-dependent dehydrogenase (short-subunit alcohol dehydrogenase family)
MGALDERVIVVTGSGRGIGAAVAKFLAAHGARVVVNDPGVNVDGTGADRGPADEVVREITEAGGIAAANNDTVATVEGGENMIKQAIDTWGRVDGVVHVAGILRDRMVFNMTEQEWDIVVAVHMKGTFNTIKHAGLIFRQQRSGRIINTSSSSGLGNAGQANYAAAKEGIVGITRTVARDLGRYGVTCNALRPGAATRLTLSPEMEAARQAAIARGENRRGMGGNAGAMDPDRIGPFVAYLASDDAQNINGRDFMIRGNAVGLYTIPTLEQVVYSPGDSWTNDDMFRVFPETIGRTLKNEFGPKE